MMRLQTVRSGIVLSVVLIGVITLANAVYCIYERESRIETTDTRRSISETIDDVSEPVTYKVTAYCPCALCCGKVDGVTASGYKIKKGDKFCASPLPFYTLLDIPGYGIVPVLDRGGAIKENCIDVYFDTHQEALNWGVQYLEVTIRK